MSAMTFTFVSDEKHFFFWGNICYKWKRDKKIERKQALTHRRAHVTQMSQMLKNWNSKIYRQKLSHNLTLILLLLREQNQPKSAKAKTE